jgi:uncharacterized protein YceK
MRIVVIAFVLVLSGCSTVEGWFGGDKPTAKEPPAAATQTSGAKLTITKATWAAFENYKYWLTPIAWHKPMGQGYFAVAEDGRSWGLTGCPVNECVAGMPVSKDAVDICLTRSSGVPCVVFARDETILVPYDVAE